MDERKGVRSVQALRMKAFSRWEAGSNDIATLDRIRRQMAEINVLEGSELTFTEAIEIQELVKMQDRD